MAKHSTPNGVHKGKSAPISTGLQPGGVLSSILGHPHLAQRQAQASLPARFFLDLFFADGNTIALTAPELTALAEMTIFNDQAVHETLRLGVLRTQTEKTQNLLIATGSTGAQTRR